MYIFRECKNQGVDGCRRWRQRVGFREQYQRVEIGKGWDKRVGSGGEGVSRQAVCALLLGSGVRGWGQGVKEAIGKKCARCCSGMKSGGRRIITGPILLFCLGAS